MLRSLSLVSWALNEEANVIGFVERAEVFLTKVTRDFEVLIIDDGSTDSTWQILQEMQVGRPWLRTLRNSRNRGVGFCTKTALVEARKEFVFWQTQDWSYDLRWFESNMPSVLDFDVVHGSRWIASKGLNKYLERSDTPWKGLVSLVNYFTIRLLFRVPFSDVQNVTLYPRALVASLVLQSESSFTNPECLIRVWNRGVSVLEVPVPFVPREKGVAKGTRLPAILRALRDILKFRLSYRQKSSSESRLVRWGGQ
jgi:glycosyltransferase involved in cell wall biosynthesis